jgi:hypothetical protein
VKAWCRRAHELERALDQGGVKSVMSVTMLHHCEYLYDSTLQERRKDRRSYDGRVSQEKVLSAYSVVSVYMLYTRMSISIIKS